MIAPNHVDSLQLDVADMRAMIHEMRHSPDEMYSRLQRSLINAPNAYFHYDRSMRQGYYIIEEMYRQSLLLCGQPQSPNTIMYCQECEHTQHAISFSTTISQHRPMARRVLSARSVDVSSLPPLPFQCR